jgi:hypothetical protein
MKILHRLAFVLIGCTLAACPATVVTTAPPPSRPMPPPAAPAWDSTGWTLLGTQVVNGRVDRDVIRVGRYEGKFDKLTMVVTDSDLELLDFIVVFANGERWEPKLKHVFSEGQRSRSMDLPGHDRVIASIELLYKNLPGGGRAKVEVYGKDVANRPHVEPPPVVVAPPPMPPPPPPVAEFDSAGWTELGSQWVDGKRDKDVYRVGRGKGRFDKIVIAVKDSDLEMLDFVVVFENGEKFEPKLRHIFNQGSRSHSIDLPGSDRYIKEIHVKYANLPGGGKARVELWGKDTNQGKNPKRNKDEDKDPKDPKFRPKK